MGPDLAETWRIFFLFGLPRLLSRIVRWRWMSAARSNFAGDVLAHRRAKTVSSGRAVSPLPPISGLEGSGKIMEHLRRDNSSLHLLEPGRVGGRGPSAPLAGAPASTSAFDRLVVDQDLHLESLTRSAGL